MARMELERMNQILNAHASGVPIDEACATGEERAFYEELEAAQERLERTGMSQIPVQEWP